MKECFIFWIGYFFIFSTQKGIFAKNDYFSSLVEPKDTSYSLNAYATKYGRVPLLKDEVGFYIPVDLKNDIDDASDSEFGPDTVPIILGLYTSQTLLSKKCLNLGIYDCESYKCVSNETNFTELSLPYFEAGGYCATAEMYLDYSYWELNQMSNAAIATSCNSKRSKFSGVEKFGIIGMGTGGKAKTNFLKASSAFSVYIRKNLLDGFLIFGKDLMAYAYSNTPSAILSGDEDWLVRSNGQTSIGIQDLTVSAQFDLMFDVNLNGIGLPLDLYFGVIKALEKATKMVCNVTNAYPTCIYQGETKHLPNMIINISGSVLIIPPQVYVQNSEMSILRLNLIGMSSDLGETSFITPKYSTFVILGVELMSFYYTVFSISDHSILLYEAITEREGESWLAIFVECIGFIFFILTAWLCCYVLNRTKETPDNSSSGQNQCYTHVGLLAPDSPRIRQVIRSSHLDSPRALRHSIFSFGNNQNPNPSHSHSHEVQIKSIFAK